jgi:hypothetical protein
MRLLWCWILCWSSTVGAATAFVAVPNTNNGVPIVDASERIDKQVKITQLGAQFLWASNQNVPLTRHFKGNKIIFVADGGEGMIVVLNQSNLPEGQRQGDGRPFLYCEHVRTELLISSFCGGSQEVAVDSR